MLSVGLGTGGEALNMVGREFLNDSQLGKPFVDLAQNYWGHSTPAAKAGWYDPSNLAHYAASMMLIFRNPQRAIRKSGVWSLGPGPRGLAIEARLGGNLPVGFRVIDRFDQGVATRIKSIDLNAKTYQDTRALTSLLNGFIDRLVGWSGQTTPYAGVVIQPGQVTAKTLQIAIPPRSTSAAQKAIFDAAAQRAQSSGINFIITVVQ